MFGPDDIADWLTGGNQEKALGEYDKARGVLEHVNPETGASAYGSTDPATRAAQMDALASLKAKYTSGGLDAIDRARLGEINQNQTQAASTARAGATQDAARRGMFNSGNALVAAQIGGQQAVTQGSNQARDAAALAEASRLNEINQAGGLAGDVRGQDYQKASALDAIARFNAAQRLARAGGVAGSYYGKAGQYDRNASRTFGMVKDAAKAGMALGTGGAFAAGADAEDVPGMLGYT